MKGFRGTVIFALVVGAVGGFALYELKQSKVEEEAKVEKDAIYGGLKAEEASELAVTSEGRGFRLQMAAGQWRLIEPISDVADAGVIESYLRDMFSTRVEKLDLEGETADLAKYGLDKPGTQVTFKMSDGKEYGVAVGTVRTFDDGYYLKKSGSADISADIWVGDSAWSGYLDKSADHFRSKQIHFPAGELGRLRIVSNLSDRSFQYEFKSENGKWILNGQPGIRLQDSMINGILTSLRALRADAIEENSSDPVALKKYGLNKPVLHVELDLVQEGRASTVKISFAHLKAGETDAIMWASTNKPLYRLARSRLAEYAKPLNDFREKTHPFRFADAEAAEVEIKKNSGKEPLRLVKSSGSWSFPERQADKVNQGEVKSLLAGIAGLKAHEFFSGRKVKSENELSVKNDKGDVLFSLQFAPGGKSKDGAEVYLAKTNLSDETVSVTKASMDTVWGKNLIEPKPVPATAPEAPAAVTPDKEQHGKTGP